MRPSDFWPLFDLVVRTPRLELRYPDDDLAAEVAALAVEGIHPPDFQPFEILWDEVPSPHQQRNSMQFYWRSRADWSPTNWHCPLAVLVDGRPVGTQGVMAAKFHATRTVATGSWLGLAHQGKGLGKEMRTAVLHLAFEGLGAERAESAAWHDNAQSRGVSRSVGYVENGDEIKVRKGKPDRQVRFVMDRAAWEARRRDDITIEGLEPCLPFFGAVDAEWLVPATG